ncbi:MAG: S53 family peptidase [Candidatus Acidiferrales bacterium]
MRLRPIVLCSLVLAALSIALVSQRSAGQSGAARPLITQPVDDSKLTFLRGNTHPLARAQYDQGAVSPSLPMNRMMLVLKRPAPQESALETLLAQQTDKSSANYHKWLTPAQFGDQFGVADEDVQKISTWLESRGFQSVKASNGRNVIEFSGNAGQVQAAFHTAIHSYLVNGRQHWANASDPSIPQALTSAVAGAIGLNNFPKKAMHHFAGTFRKPLGSSRAEPTSPQYTFTSGGYAYYALGPQDFANIYNVTPLWNAGITGQGITIAIVSDSDVNPTDLSQFRSLFGLPSANFQRKYAPGSSSSNPGIQTCQSGGDECEADIDIEWSGAVAKDATIDLVIAQNVDLAAQYVVDNNLAPILSESYGACELGLGTSENAFYNSLWQEASGLGITALVSAGDSGSSACDYDVPPTPPALPTPQPAEFGLAVSGLASTPYDVAVGGTDFNQFSNPAEYWSSSNASGTEASAKGYIPETTWNDSCTNAILESYFSTDAETNCNDFADAQQGYFVIGPVGGSGGMSNCTVSNSETVSSCSGGYAKPSWQTGTGVPSDGKRDVPDISLFAGDGFAGSFYIVCEEDYQGTTGQPTSCNLSANGYADFAGFGGTSVSTQVFAGMVALMNQQSQARQGNLNPMLYGMAAHDSASNCNSANPSSTCVFRYISVGTNAQPCAKGTPNCTVTNSGDSIGILTGYTTGTQYSLATGLGSVNANNLVSGVASSFSLSSAKPVVDVPAPGNSGTMSATVTAQSGFSGTVTFSCGSLPLGASCSFNPPSVALSATTTSASTLLTVSTTAPSLLAPAREPLSAGPRATTIALTLSVLVCIGLLLLTWRRPRLRSGAAFALLVVALLLVASCGGGGGGGGNTGGNGTPTGSSSAVINGSSGAATSSLNFTLDVE